VSVFVLSVWRRKTSPAHEQFLTSLTVPHFASVFLFFLFFSLLAQDKFLRDNLMAHDILVV